MTVGMKRLLGGKSVMVIEDQAENFGEMPDVGVAKYSLGP